MLHMFCARQKVLAEGDLSTTTRGVSCRSEFVDSKHTRQKSRAECPPRVAALEQRCWMTRMCRRIPQYPSPTFPVGVLGPIIMPHQRQNSVMPARLGCGGRPLIAFAVSPPLRYCPSKAPRLPGVGFVPTSPAAKPNSLICAQHAKTAFQLAIYAGRTLSTSLPQTQQIFLTYDMWDVCTIVLSMMYIRSGRNFIFSAMWMYSGGLGLGLGLEMPTVLFGCSKTFHDSAPFEVV